MQTRQEDEVEVGSVGLSTLRAGEDDGSEHERALRPRHRTIAAHRPTDTQEAEEQRRGELHGDGGRQRPADPTVRRPRIGSQAQHAEQENLEVDLPVEQVVLDGIEEQEPERDQRDGQRHVGPDDAPLLRQANDHPRPRRRSDATLTRNHTTMATSRGTAVSGPSIAARNSGYMYGRVPPIA